MTAGNSSRMTREKKTLLAMIRIYCRAQHGSRGGLCPDCQALQDYALARLGRCPFGAKKPTCAQCTVHCYKPQMQRQIRDVMRFSGPRMIFRRPILAIRHLLDARRSKKK
ncbi:MAG: nitrous oxide-stimulated promoter family protein [Pirellulales bacterium]|nr:nitrous oxide-stimulated promoter family protein [Pirellulales bacterium]